MGTFGKRPMKPYLTVPFSMQLTGTKLDRKFAAHPFVPEDMVERNRRCEDILSIQAFGLKRDMSISDVRQRFWVFQEDWIPHWHF